MSMFVTEQNRTEQNRTTLYCKSSNGPRLFADSIWDVQ